MKDMKEIKTNGITILFVEVPEDAKEFDISDMGSLIYYVEWGNSGYIDLQQGNYQILGKSTEPIHELLGISKEEYLDLLHTHCIVDRNAEGELWHHNRYNKLHKNMVKMGISHMTYAEYKKNWQEAQSKVKTYLVLKRI